MDIFEAKTLRQIQRDEQSHFRDKDPDIVRTRLIAAGDNIKKLAKKIPQSSGALKKADKAKIKKESKKLKKLKGKTKSLRSIKNFLEAEQRLSRASLKGQRRDVGETDVKIIGEPARGLVYDPIIENRRLLQEDRRLALEDRARLREFEQVERRIGLEERGRVREFEQRERRAPLDGVGVPEDLRRRELDFRRQEAGDQAQIQRERIQLDAQRIDADLERERRNDANRAEGSERLRAEAETQNEWIRRREDSLGLERQLFQREQAEVRDTASRFNVDEDSLRFDRENLSRRLGGVEESRRSAPRGSVALGAGVPFSPTVGARVRSPRSRSPGPTLEEVTPTPRKSPDLPTPVVDPSPLSSVEGRKERFRKDRASDSPLSSVEGRKERFRKDRAPSQDRPYDPDYVSPLEGLNLSSSIGTPRKTELRTEFVREGDPSGGSVVKGTQESTQESLLRSPRLRAAVSGLKETLGVDPSVVLDSPREPEPAPEPEPEPKKVKKVKGPKFRKAEAGEQGGVTFQSNLNVKTGETQVREYRKKDFGWAAPVLNRKSDGSELFDSGTKAAKEPWKGRKEKLTFDDFDEIEHALEIKEDLPENWMNDGKPRPKTATYPHKKGVYKLRSVGKSKNVSETDQAGNYNFYHVPEDPTQPISKKNTRDGSGKSSDFQLNIHRQIDEIERLAQEKKLAFISNADDLGGADESFDDVEAELDAAAPEGGAGAEAEPEAEP